MSSDDEIDDIFPSTSRERSDFDIHHVLCTNRAEDTIRMQKVLQSWNSFPARTVRTLNPYIAHAVDEGHDVCVNFFLSLGPVGSNWNVRDLLKRAVTNSHPAVFQVLLSKGGCTQSDVDYSLESMVNDIPTDIHRKLSILKHVVNHGFKFENYDHLFDPDYDYYAADREIQLSTKFILSSVILKFLLLNGGIVDYRQLLPCPEICADEKDELSLIQKFIEYLDREFTLHPYLEHYLPCLYILQQCGANFAEINMDGMSILDMIEDRKDAASANVVQNHMFHSNVPYDQLSDKVRSYINEPLSLQSLSRLSLMRHLKCNYLKSVNKLDPKEYPKDLIDFLKGDDMKVNQCDLALVEHANLSEKLLTYKTLIDNMCFQYATSLTLDCRPTSKFFMSDSDSIDELNQRLANLEVFGHKIMNSLYRI